MTAPFIPDPIVAAALRTASLEPRKLPRAEANLLVYLECRCVDHGGLINPVQVNKEEREIIARWEDEGYLLPIVGRDMVRLSEQAWVDAHAERRARYERLIKLEPA